MKLERIVVCSRCGYRKRCETFYSSKYDPDYSNKLDLIKDVLTGPERCNQKRVWEMEDERSAEEAVDKLKDYSSPFNHPMPTMI